MRRDSNRARGQPELGVKLSSLSPDHPNSSLEKHSGSQGDLKGDRQKTSLKIELMSTRVWKGMKKTVYKSIREKGALQRKDSKL